MDETTKQEQHHEESMDENQENREHRGDIESYPKRTRNLESNYKIKKKKRNATPQQSQSIHSHSRSRSPCGTKTSGQWMSSNAFINFVQDFRKNFTGIKSTRIFQMAGERWKRMPPDEKQPYLKAAMSVRNKKQIAKKVENMHKLDSDTEDSKNENIHKKEKIGKKERKKQEPKKTAKKKHNSESDCDSMTSGTISNTTDDISDDSS